MSWPVRMLSCGAQRVLETRREVLMADYHMNSQIVVMTELLVVMTELLLENY